MTQPLIHWVRHGQSTWNAAGRMQGRAQHPPLTTLGRSQAHVAAQQLIDAHASSLLSSPAVRARQSAEIIAEHTRLPVIIEPLLIEKGLDEDWSGVRARLETFLGRARHNTIAVSHGDVIALAMQYAGHTVGGVAANGSVTTLPALT